MAGYRKADNTKPPQPLQLGRSFGVGHAGAYVGGGVGKRHSDHSFVRRYNTDAQPSAPDNVVSSERVASGQR